MNTDDFGDMRTEYGKSLVELGEQDKNVVVLGADTTDSLRLQVLEKNFLNVSLMLELQKQILCLLLLD